MNPQDSGGISTPGIEFWVGGNESYILRGSSDGTSNQVQVNGMPKITRLKASDLKNKM